MPKQLINVLGLVVVMAILVAGIALVAVPLYGGSLTTDAQTRTVTQTNGVYDVQVAHLSAEEDRIDEITADVALLRREIAGEPRVDDVIELATAAASQTGAVIENITAAEPEPWTPRTGLAAEEQTAEAPAAETEQPADAGEPTTPEGAVADDTIAAEPVESPQRQVAITIQVKIADAATAAAFIDALGSGPRLVAPIDTAYDAGTLTVTALAFIRTED